MTIESTAAWRAAELVLDQQKMFVLWLVAKGLCKNASDFESNFGDARLVRAVDELVEKGFLQNKAKGIYLSSAGEAALSYLPNAPRKQKDTAASLKRGEFPAHTWGWELLGVPRLHVRGMRGSGVRVGVLDSGVDANHPDLIFRIRQYRSVCTDIEQTLPSDVLGHGTHVAGIIAGNNSSGTMIGGAPDSELSVAAVFDDKGTASAQNAFVGIEWLASCSDIICLCVSLNRVSKAMRTVFRSAIGRLSENYGIPCVLPAGNEPDDESIGALMDGIFCCGAIQRDGSTWPLSGMNPDFVLPGVGIFSSVPSGLRQFGGHSYAFMTGTSMAAAHMSGLLALVMEAAPRIPPNRLKKLFQNHASNHGKFHERSGWGIPDVSAVITAARHESSWRETEHHGPVIPRSAPLQLGIDWDALKNDNSTIGLV